MRNFYKILSYLSRTNIRTIGFVWCCMWFLSASTTAFAQSIQIVDADPGPYSAGSDITVRIKVDGCFNGTNGSNPNKYELYISDANGSFASNNLIGSFEGHFSTYVNGIIPTGTPAGSGYLLKVKSSSPVAESNISAPINIVAPPAQVPNVVVTAPLNRTIIPETAFGYCSGIQDGNVLSLENKSTAGAVVTAKLYSDYKFSDPPKIVDFSTNAFQDLILERTYYSFVVKAVKNGVVSTRSYLVFNMIPNLGLQDSGNDNICLPGKLVYSLNILGNESIEVNYPGILYKFIWGDGKEDLITHCELIKKMGRMEHEYENSSCSEAPIILPDRTIYNSYRASVAIQSNYCSSNNRIYTAYPKVSLKPKARFTGPEKACINSDVFFTNSTIPGEDVGAGTGQCSQATDYEWYVNDVKKAVTKDFKYSFSTPGTYKIKLVSKSNSCFDEKEAEICISAPANPDFNFTQSAICFPTTITATNTTDITNLCDVKYKWEVIPDPSNITPAVFDFVNGVSNQRDAQINILSQGKFIVRLTVGNDQCGYYEKDQPVVVSGQIDVTIPQTVQQYCNSVIIDFGTNPNHKPEYIGAYTTQYFKWEITGGAFAFVGGTSDISAYPQIEFKEPKDYTVKVIYDNDCNSARSASQTIKLHPSAIGGTTSGSTLICGGNTSGTVILSGNNGTILRWEKLEEGASTWEIVPGTSSVLSYYGLMITTQYRAVIESGTCPEAYSSVTTISIKPTPAKPITERYIKYCLDDPAAPLTATGDAGNTITWYTDATLQNGTSTPPTFNTSTDGQKGPFYVTQTNSIGCTSDTAKVIVQVYTPISNNLIGSSQTICFGGKSNTLGTLSGNIAGGNAGHHQYQWQTSADGITWDDIVNATGPTFIAGPSTSTARYRRVIKSGNCVSTSNDITITVLDILSNYNINNLNQTICAGDIPAILDGQTPSGGGNGATYSYKWMVSVDNTIWADAGGTGEDFLPSALNSLQYYKRITTVSANGISCTYESSLARINVNPKPVFTDISDKFFCNGLAFSSNSIVFSSSHNAKTRYIWQSDNSAIGLAQLTGSTDRLPGFTTTNTSKAPIFSTITVTPIYDDGDGFPCSGEAGTFRIYVLPSISLQPISDITVCSGSTVYASGFAPATDADPFAGSEIQYKWTVSGQGISLVNGSGDKIPSFTTLNDGTTDLQATIIVTPVYKFSSRSCEGNPLSYKIIVQPKPSVANAGTDILLCGDSYTLKANAPLVGSGKWAQIAGPAVTITDPNLPETTITGLTQGQRHKFAWTITNGFCNASSDTVNVDVLSELKLESDKEFVCKSGQVLLSSSFVSSTISLERGGAIDYTWEFLDGAIWRTLQPFGFEDLQAYPPEKTTYRLKVTSRSGSCSVFSNAITINIYPSPPISNAGGTKTICNATSFKLNANNPDDDPEAGNPNAAFKGTWTVEEADNTLSFSDLHSPTAIVSGLLPGKTYKLKWTITSLFCGESSSVITIHNQKPIINEIFSSTQPVCYGVPSIVAGNQPTGGDEVNYTYSWSISTNQVDWTPLVGLSGKNFFGVLPGLGTLYVKRTVESGACSQESNIATVTIQPPISNNTISADQTICTGTSPVLLTGSTPAGGGNGDYFYEWQKSTDGLSFSSNGMINARDKDYQPEILTQTAWFRRVVTTLVCTGSGGSYSDTIKITVNPDAKAEFSASLRASCAPFNLSSVINVVEHPDRNKEYFWYADDVQIGTGAAFPGYTITEDGRSVTIKLLALSEKGCKNDFVSLTFKTIGDFTPKYTKDVVKDCGPVDVTFNNTSSTATGDPLSDLTFAWYNGPTKFSDSQEIGTLKLLPHPQNRDTTYVITLKVTNGCIEKSFVDSVLVRSKPKAIFSPNKTVGCSPFILKLTNQSRGVDSKYGTSNKYTVYFGDGNKVVKTDNSPIEYTYNTGKTDTLTVKLVAENECGKDSSSYDIIVYPNKILPELVLVGSSQYGCAPFTVSFDNNTIGATSFVWDFNDLSTESSSVSPERKTHEFKKAGIYKVTLYATNGCSDTTTTEEIFVYNKPVASFSIVRPQYCVNDSVVFVNSNTSTDVTYQWDFGDGTFSHERQPKHPYTAAGKYTVKLTVIQRFPNGSECSSITTKEVTVIKLPQTAFTTNEAAVNCAPFKLSVNSTSADATNVQWDFGDPLGLNNIASGKISEHTYQRGGVYQVKAKFFNSAGCVDSLTKTVIVEESPVTDFTMSTSAICGHKGTVTFTNTSTFAGSGSVTYKWFINNIPVPGSHPKDLINQLVEIPTGTALPAKVEVRLEAYGPLCSNSKSYYLDFNPLPKAIFTPVNTIDCAPFKVQVTNTSLKSDFYKWYVDDELVSSDAIPQNIILKDPGRNYTVMLVAGNDFGCKLDSLPMIFKTKAIAKADFTIKDSISCNGKLEVKITNNTVGGTCSWDFGDGSLPFMGPTPPPHFYGVGSFKLRLITDNGSCKDTLIRNINVAATPRPAFIASTQTGCESVEIAFRNLSVNADTFEWDFGDGEYSTEKEPKHRFLYINSPYTVKLRAIGEFGCDSTIVMTDYIKVSAPPVSNFDILPDTLIRTPNYTFTFRNTSTGNPAKFKWIFGDGKTSTEENPPPHAYPTIGKFYVQLITTNSEGCSDTLGRTVNIESIPGYLFVPNAFEPGNLKPELQVFKPKGSRLAKYSFKVFNRWGELIWQTDKLDEDGVPVEGWNGFMKGSPAPQGVYIWDISAIFMDGTEWKGMKYENSSPRKSGSVYLMR